MDDRAAIQDLLVRFCYLVDTGQGERVAHEIFAPDATIDYGDGPVALVGNQQRAHHRTLLEGTVHSLSNFLITVDGDEAHALAYVTGVHWLQSSAAGGPLRPADYVTTTAYDNDLRRGANGWRITARRIRPLGKGVIAAGDASSGFTDLLATIASAPRLQLPAD
jgi:hypothetical protein